MNNPELRLQAIQAVFINAIELQQILRGSPRLVLSSTDLRVIYLLARGAPARPVSAAIKAYLSRRKIRAASPSRVVLPTEEAKRKTRSARVAGRGRPSRKGKR